MTQVFDMSDLDKIDRYVRAFEIEKEKHALVHIRSFLPGPSDPVFPAVLRELILVEIELDGTRGVSDVLRKYIDDLPELWDAPGLVAEIESELRRSAERSTSLSAGSRPRTDYSRPGERIGTNQSIDRCPNPTGLPRDPSPAHGRAVVPPSGQASLPEVGQTFEGFRLMEELGRGTFGRVFLAAQGDLADRPVALKVAVDESDEARTLARLQHTNIVPIYSVHRAPPLIAVCMPYFGSLTFKDIQERRAQSPSLPATGRSLFELAANAPSATMWNSAIASTVPDSPLSSGPAPLPQPVIEARIQLENRPFDEAILWLFARLAEGLEHAHRRGILHRDIKPANILLTDDGQPMLLDFNLAEDRELAPQSASRMGGTLPYMSPEQLEALLGSGRRIDARSDVFALGVILFELLTGQSPYPRSPGHDAPAVALMLDDRKAGPPDPRRLDRSIRPATASILRRCLEPIPARRYQSAGELLDDLERQLANLPLKHARDRNIPERVQKWVRRHPSIRSLGTLAIASAALVTLLGAGIWIRAERLADIEARDAFEAFRRDLRQASLKLTTADPVHRAGAVRETRLALERYRILDDPDWRSSSRVARLASPSRQLLREQVGESLESLANALAFSAASPSADEPALREALDLNRSASTCYDPADVPRSLLLQRADLLRSLGRDAEANTAASIADATPIQSHRDRLLMARLAITRGEPAKVAELLRPITQDDPKAFWAWYLLAIAYERLQDPISAEAAYTACLSLDPGFEEPWSNRGLARARRGDLAGAHDDLTRAIALRPYQALPYLNRGLVDRGRKRFESALKDVTRSIDLGAPGAYAYAIRSLIHNDSGNAQQAATDRNEGLRHTPGSEDAWIARGLSRMSSDPNAALGDFDAALRLNPRSLAALQNKAAILSSLPGRDEDALDALTSATTLFPDLADLHSGRARMLAVLRRRDQAIEAAEKALALSHSPHILYQVGCAYALTSTTHREDRDPALRLLSQALRNGFGHREIAHDDDLTPIRDDPRFQRLLESARETTAVTKAP